MMSILITIVAFLFAISILIAVHEFGHYWVAKKLGVKILRYSIGFGKPLWKKTAGTDNTEYVIAALPLGGYVKMLDEREGDVDESEAHRAFNRQSIWSRIAIVFAGPAFNFLFAIFAYWLMFVVGVSGIKPIIGDVDKDSVAASAGLAPGYEIIAIDNNRTPIWDVAIQRIIPAMVDRTKVEMTVKDKQGMERNVALDFSSTEGEIKVEKIFTAAGFQPWRPPVEAVVAQVLENSPAANAGFLIGDKIVSIDGQVIDDWHDVLRLVSVKPAQILAVTVLRDSKEHVLKVIPETIVRDGKEVGRIGIGQAGSQSFPDDMRVDHGYGLFESVGKSVGRTWDYSILTLKMLGKIITGEISVKNLSGPVNIAVYAGYSASAGVARFLDFLAIVSISLGVLNLLPIPVLDGGHLMYYLIELVQRKPVSDETQEFASRVGIALLLLLMSVALYNDMLRLFGS